MKTMYSPLAMVAAGILALSCPASAFGHEGVTAPTPEGGVGWDVLMSSQAVAWEDLSTGTEHLRPEFSPEVVALRNKAVTVSGFMMPLDEGKAEQTHFLLFRSAPDCLFHMSLGPTQFIEVHTDKPVELTDRAIVLHGTMNLVDADRGGIFYRINDGQLVSVF